MSAKWVLRGGMVLVVAALAAGVFMYASESPDERGKDHHPIPDHEFPRLTRVMMRYDDASAALAFDYRANRVSAKQWLQRSNDQLPKMVSALSHLESRLFGVSGRHAADLRKFVQLSRDELEALFELRDALADMDPTHETYAWDHWARAADRKFRFLSDYYYRRKGSNIDYGSIPPSIPLKSLA